MDEDIKKSELSHIGTYYSGRYPRGSGGHSNQQQGRPNFLKTVSELKKQGMTETEIQEALGMKAGEYRSRKTIAIADNRQNERNTALKLKDKGMSISAIGRQMGKNESSIRKLLDPVINERAEMVRSTAMMLEENIANKKYLDVGAGVEHTLGISREKLNSAIQILTDNGYKVNYVYQEQAGTGKKTTIKVLTKDDVGYAELMANKDSIGLPTIPGKDSTPDHHTNDGGLTYYGLKPVENVSPKRVAIRYAEDGGVDKDGVIELRRGVPDIDLGNKRYAQVRIAVNGTHYIKGMAVYADDLPDGVDIRFNTNKSKDVPMLGEKDNTVLKRMSVDPNNPFGAVIKPGGQRGALNIVNEEGDWAKWSKNLSTQMLAKQPRELVKKQLDLAYANMEEDYESVKNITHPAVRKKLLLSFSEDCDAAASHLKAAAMPRQATSIILPFPDMKENQVYAPNYKNGEKIVLIRHPHGGTFEIPVLTVNNNFKQARNLLGDSPDAVGIHPKVAQQLSGADFDGDHVITIPTNGKTIKTSSPLKGLKDFDPKAAYPPTQNSKRMKEEHVPRQMGGITNLITDMTIRGATESDLTRAIKHSMVVIDAEKHGLDYVKSFDDNGIASLKKTYQGSSKAGASTLLSRASSIKRIPEVKEYSTIDPETGVRTYIPTGATYTSKKTGKVVQKLSKITRMADVDDAFKLSSGTKVEGLYAQYANKLKALANTARKEHITTPLATYSPSANKTYKTEVDSLNAKLNVALMNAPYERKAQLVAGKVIQLARADYYNNDIKKKDLKKITGQSITEARRRVGAGKTRISITPKEWEAIQAGAVSNNTIVKMLNNTDADVLKQYAMPRSQKLLTPAKLAKAKTMSASGYTQADIADALGVSPSLISKTLGE